MIPLRYGIVSIGKICRLFRHLYQNYHCQWSPLVAKWWKVTITHRTPCNAVWYLTSCCGFHNVSAAIRYDPKLESNTGHNILQLRFVDIRNTLWVYVVATRCRNPVFWLVNTTPRCEKSQRVVKSHNVLWRFPQRVAEIHYGPWPAMNVAPDRPMIESRPNSIWRHGQWGVLSVVSTKTVCDSSVNFDVLLIYPVI